MRDIVGLFAWCAAAGAAWAVGATSVEASEPVRALLLTGENNHNWRFTSRVHKETLEATGRFEVRIAEDPAAALSDPARLGEYDLIVLDYNGPRWGEAAERNFAEAVRSGTGVVVIHAANNAFDGWEEYESLCGLLWRDGTGHGRFHTFDVRIVDAEHPVTEGLGDLKDHPDELYHKLVNTQDAAYRVLAEAYSAPESGGSGNSEPMAIALEFGKGRVFHTPLGHVWTNVETTKASVLDPRFRTLLARGSEWAATGEVTVGESWNDNREHNTLSPEEKTEGWVLLFNGRELPTAMRGFRQAAMPEKGWVVEEGTLRKVAGAGGGDIVTSEQFGDFEFQCEWKVGPKGNSGVIYRATEDHSYAWETGPEMQILDNAGHPDSKDQRTSAGAIYGLYACEHDVVRPAGEWNHAKIVVRGDHVEHWLNGVKVAEAEMNGPEWNKRVSETKFAKMPNFGKRAKGHIALQDHGDDVWFRNIKVRALDGTDEPAQE